MDSMPLDVQCLIVAGVDRPDILRTGCQGLRGLVNSGTTKLSLRRDVLSAPSTQAVLHLVQRMPLLASLSIRRWWPDVQWAAVLAACTGLQTLDLCGCDRVADLSPLAACAGLQTLDLCGCDRLADLSALAACTRLHTLIQTCQQKM